MLKRSVYIVFVVLILLPMVLSQESPLTNPVFKQNTDVTLSIPCTINGGYCSANSSCLGTVINPTQIVLYNEASLSKNGGVFELQINSSDTSSLGEYQFNVVCADGGRTRSRFLKFEVTPNGEKPTTSTAMMYVAVLVILFLLFIIDIYSLLKADQMGWKVFLFLAGYLMLISISFISWNLGMNFLASNLFLVSFFSISFKVLMYGLLPVIVLIFGYMVLMTIKVREVQGLINRGYTNEEINEREGYKKKKRWF